MTADQSPDQAQTEALVYELKKRLGLIKYMGTLGDSDDLSVSTVDAPRRPGWVRVRLHLDDVPFREVKCGLLGAYSPYPGSPVVVGYDEKGDLAIEKADFDALLEAKVNPLIFNSGDNRVSGFAQTDSLLPLWCGAVSEEIGTASTKVGVNSYRYVDTANTVHFFEALKVDLAGEIPGANLHCYTAIFLKNDDTIQLVSSTPIALITPLQEADKQECFDGRDDNTISVWLWRLHNNQASITNADKVEDLRPWMNNPSGGTGAITVSDSQFAVFNDADNSKILNFDASIISAATTRTLVIPDADGTIALVNAGAVDPRYVEVAGDTMTGQLFIDGGADEIQLRVQGAAGQTANLQTWESSAGGILTRVLSNGYLDVGAPQTGGLTIVGNFQDTFIDVSGIALSGIAVAAITGNSAIITTGFNSIVRTSATAFNYTSVLALRGLRANARHLGTGTVAGARSATVRITNSSTGIITRGYGLFVETPTNDGGGTITNSYGLYVEDHNVGGTLNYAIYTNAGDITLNAGLGQCDFLLNGDNYALIQTDSSDDEIWIGNNAAAKISFFAATPIVQPTVAIAAAAFVANTSGIADDTATWDGYTIGQVVKALRNEGLLA